MCLTCPKYITEHKFKNINHFRENITYHTQNVIYFLSCNQCNVQYVGETTLPLHKRINLHSRTYTRCKNVIIHFKDVCVHASCSVQTIEAFPGTWYRNSYLCPNNSETWLVREVRRMETLRTSYPYGLIDRKRNPNPNLPFGCSFAPFFPRSKQR